MGRGGAAGREILDHTGDLLGVGARLVGPHLRSGDAGGGDELHGSGDLLGRLDAADATTQCLFLTSGHGSLSLPRGVA